MIGISAMGVYLPSYRISREVLTGRPSRGEKTVANYDEDALTMGVEAAFECVANHARAWGETVEGSRVRGLFFASASSPFREKQASSVLRSVLEFDRTALVTDLQGSLRGGLTALTMGEGLLNKGEPGAKVLIVSSDRRRAEPRSREDSSFGDGAAALLLGTEDLLATVEGHVTLSANFPHFWRRESDPYVRAGDGRFVENEGYLALAGEAIRALLDGAGLRSEQIAKLVAYAPSARLAQRLAKRCGFDASTQLAGTLLDSVGDTGTAQVFLGLADALTRADPGQWIVAVGYGDGAEAVLLKTTDEVSRLGACRPVERHLKRGRALTSYAKYLQFQDVVGESSYDAFSSLALLWREEKQNLRLYGARCRSCGAIHFPRRRVCARCGGRDELEDLKLSRRGRIYTYTNDYVYLNPDPPETLAAIDLEGGGRFFGQVTDVDPVDIRIGLEVELGFRKLHDGQGLPNYFWKARPVDGKE